MRQQVARFPCAAAAAQHGAYNALLFLRPLVSSANRIPLVDALKAVASQLIVLHHLAWYGPLAEAAEPLAPALFDWLCQYARIAVQGFLVVAGYLAARTLAPAGAPRPIDPLAALARRYARLAPPYLAALAAAVAAAAVARALAAHDSIPAAPTLSQLLAHALLLQDVLDHEVLSAGVWYVAIDFQLFALLVALLWAARRLGGRPAAIGLVSAAAAASLLYFNRDESWDVWALYFIGSYGLGVLACWIAASGRPWQWSAALLAAGLAVLAVDFRLRISVALATALLLAVSRGGKPMAGMRYLADISYSLFLVHYPVSLIVSAAFDRLAPGDPELAMLGLASAWAASIAAAVLFHRQVECRALAFALPARLTGPRGRSA